MNYLNKVKKIFLQQTKNYIFEYIRLYKLLFIFFKRPFSIFDFLRLNGKYLIIEVEYGGLGDHLFHSHLPKLAKESLKFDAVYLSNLSPFRKPAHKDAIWGKNPYLDGYINWFGFNFRRLIKNKNVNLNNSEVNKNILDEIMVAFELDDGNRFHDPQIYYVPRRKREFEAKVIFDPNFVTPLYNTDIIYKSINAYFLHNNINIDFQFVPINPSGKLLTEEQYINDKTFEEFCDVIYACKDLYCFATGTAVLAAALGKNANVFFVDAVDERFLFSKQHNYIKL